MGRGINLTFVVDLKWPPTVPRHTLGGDSTDRGTYAKNSHVAVCIFDDVQW